MYLSKKYKNKYSKIELVRVYNSLIYINFIKILTSDKSWTTQARPTKFPGQTGIPVTTGFSFELIIVK